MTARSSSPTCSLAVRLNRSATDQRKRHHLARPKCALNVPSGKPDRRPEGPPKHYTETLDYIYIVLPTLLSTSVQHLPPSTSASSSTSHYLPQHLSFHRYPRNCIHAQTPKADTQTSATFNTAQPTMSRIRKSTPLPRRAKLRHLSLPSSCVMTSTRTVPQAAHPSPSFPIRPRAPR